MVELPVTVFGTRGAMISVGVPVGAQTLATEHNPDIPSVTLPALDGGQPKSSCPYRYYHFLPLVKKIVQPQGSGLPAKRKVRCWNLPYRIAMAWWSIHVGHYTR